MAKGFAYLVAIMDLYSRKILAWRVSNSLDTNACITTLEEALAGYGTPEIFNTDQGAQFTAHAFTGVLKQREIRISMDSKGRWIDNVFIERFWRSVKYEEVYLYAYEDLRQAKEGIRRYMAYYNAERPHSRLGKRTPNEVYDQSMSYSLPAVALPMQGAITSRPCS